LSESDLLPAVAFGLSAQILYLFLDLVYQNKTAADCS